MPEPMLLKDVLSMTLPSIEIMDVGAMMEGEDRYSPLVKQGLGTVTGFEPNPSNLAKLNARPGPYTYHPFFLGDGKKATFYLTAYPGCSSLLEPDGDIINLFSTIGAEPGTGNFSVVEKTTVETSRLDDLDEISQPDYLKIDVQGAELMVLENARNTLSKVLVLETEVEFIAIYKNQPLFCDIQKFMIEQGLMLHKLVDVAGRSLRPVELPNRYQATSQLLWADAIFVRDYTDLDTYSDEDLIKSAVILNDVYLSYDVVYRLLGEYDKRKSTDYSALYMASLKSHGDLKLMFMNLKQHV